MPYSNLCSDSEEDPNPSSEFNSGSGNGEKQGGETWGNLNSLDIVSKQTHNPLRFMRRTRCLIFIMFDVFALMNRNRKKNYYLLETFSRLTEMFTAV